MSDWTFVQSGGESPPGGRGGDEQTGSPGARVPAPRPDMWEAQKADGRVTAGRIARVMALSSSVSSCRFAAIQGKVLAKILDEATMPRKVKKPTRSCGELTLVLPDGILP